VRQIIAWILDAFDFVRFVLRRWSHDHCPEIAGSLAFTTLLALVPSFAIAVSILSHAPFFEAMMVQIKVFLLLNLVPEIAGRIITVYMAQFAANAGRLTTIGVAIVLVTAVALMLTIDRSINRIWRTRAKRPFWISVIAYVSLLVVGPVLIGVSVSVTTYLLSLPKQLANVPAPAHELLLQGIPITVSTLAFFLIYRLVPHRTVPWPHALAGGFVAALLFEGAKEGFAFYVSHAPAYSVVYGAFAAVPFFLLWVYLSWLIVLFGAELAASLGEWHAAEATAPDEAPEPPVRRARRGRARSARSSR
jgi:membrane protein